MKSTKKKGPALTPRKRKQGQNTALQRAERAKEMIKHGIQPAHLPVPRCSADVPVPHRTPIHKRLPISAADYK